MARKTSRRGGAWYDPRSWFKPSCEKATKTSADADAAASKAKATKDEVCAGESSAVDVEKVTPPPVAAVEETPKPPTVGARRRRNVTRRKTYKGGKHRRGPRA
jgi:hypothetical protein